MDAVQFSSVASGIDCQPIDSSRLSSSILMASKASLLLSSEIARPTATRPEIDFITFS